MGKLQELWESQTDGRCCKWDHYLDIYERYINQFIDKPSKYLEIGVQQGGSLNLIKKYLGDQCETVGIDVDPSCLASGREGHKIFIGNQEDPLFLLDVVNQAGPFDIIVDDGGHTAGQQIASFITLWPHLKDGGVYIVEDLHSSFSREYVDTEITAYQIINGEKSIPSLSNIMKESSSIEIFRKNHGVDSNSLTSILKK